jgi:Na+/H+-dicarboxylate symporter
MKSNLKLKDMIVLVKNWSRKNAFLFVTILSVLVGIVLGFLLRQYANLNEIEKSYVGFPGEIFLRMIKLLILPLIVSSLISSIGNIAKKNIGKQNYTCHFFSLKNV